MPPLIILHRLFFNSNPICHQYSPHLSLPQHLSQHLLELSLSCGLLGIIVASEVVALDENIGDGPLSRKLQKGILDGIAVVHLVQLNDLGIDALVKKEILGLAAEWAECLGEYNDLYIRIIA